MVVAKKRVEAQSFPDWKVGTQFGVPAKIVALLERRLCECLVVEPQFAARELVFAEKAQRGTPGGNICLAVVFGIVVSRGCKLRCLVHARERPFYHMLRISQHVPCEARPGEITEIDFSPKIAR